MSDMKKAAYIAMRTAEYLANKVDGTPQEADFEKAAEYAKEGWAGFGRYAQRGAREAFYERLENGPMDYDEFETIVDGWSNALKGRKSNMDAIRRMANAIWESVKENQQ
jgi:hypothetical protein